MLIPREIEKKVLERSRQYPVISIIGPRQSGKTTLAQSLFPDYPYISLERPDIRTQAIEDPIRFLRANPDGVVLDEVQQVPELFSYIQGIVDESKKPGQFILTGSQNFLLLERISQSLAGRVSIFRVLPFSFAELQSSPYSHDNLDKYLFTGAYPPLYDRGYEPRHWYMDYMQTYIERDVRSIRNITNLSLFQKFIGLLAGRIGQLLNLNSLANECGINHNTAQDWISVLEASYLVFRLVPHYKNFNKRLVKQSKLFFHDSGLLCALLGLKNASELSTHYLRGHIFESFVVSELVKARWEKGFTNPGYFWRDHHGHEIDYLAGDENKFQPIEIKSGETIITSMFKGLKYWCKLTGAEPSTARLVYGGREKQDRKNGRVIGWPYLSEIL